MTMTTTRMTTKCTTITFLLYYKTTNLGQMHSWKIGGYVYDDDDDGNDDNNEDGDNDNNHNNNDVNGDDNDNDKNHNNNIILLRNNQP